MEFKSDALCVLQVIPDESIEEKNEDEIFEAA